MATGLDVVYEGRRIGAIVFETPNWMDSKRVGAGGFCITFPITVQLAMANTQAPQPLVTGLSAQLSVQTQEGHVHYMGFAHHRGFSFMGAIPESQQHGELVWADALATLAFYEQLRGEHPPKMRFEVNAEICYLYPTQNSPRLRTEPRPIGTMVEVSYSRDVWLAMLRNLKIADIVIVEVPLPGQQPQGWEIVWREVVRARAAFEKGGHEGWTTCVLATRMALEAWTKIDGEAETAWPAEPRERMTLTKRERLARLRWSLHQAAHPVAHADQPEPPEDWTREEARFMLFTLCGLLAMRHNA